MTLRCVYDDTCVYCPGVSVKRRGVYSSTGGLVDAGPEYHKNLVEETAKLQRLYGGGDITSFPEFTFPG